MSLLGAGAAFAQAPRTGTADGSDVLTPPPAPSSPAVSPRAVPSPAALSPATASPAAGPLVLAGQVVDASGRKPIPDARVWAAAEPGAVVRTDAEGRFRLAAPGRRRFDLEAVAPGYLRRRVAIARPQLVSRQVGTVALARAGRLRGRVVDPQGRPLAGAAVLAIPLGAVGGRAFSPADPVADRATTDEGGRFELLAVRPEQSYEVRALLAGALPAARRATADDPRLTGARGKAEVDGGLVLVLAPARAAVGKVQDPAGRPIAGAEAVARPALRPGSAVDAPAEDGEPLVRSSPSDARGVFRLPELPAAEVELAVRRAGYAPAVFAALRIPAGGLPEEPVDLGVVTLRPGATLAGRVIDHRGQAVPGGEVFVLARPASPDAAERALHGLKPAAPLAADGRFALDDLAAGAPVHLAVRAPGFLIGQVRAVRPPTARPLVIRLEPAADLRGLVVDEAGEPVPGARVDLHWQAFLPEEPERPVGEPILRTARADGAGRFELRGLPAGAARVGVAAPAFVPLAGVEVELPRPAAAGELRLVLERGALLEGRVTSAAGEPVAAVRVGVGGAAAATNDDGRYWLEGAAPGRQEVLFLHPAYGRLARRFEIRPGVNVLDVAFEPGVEVAGRVVDDAGRPVPGARVELAPENRFEPRQYRDVAGADGRFRLSPVLAGTYRLTAGADGFTDTEHPAALAVGGEPLAGVEVVLDRGAVLAGRILGLAAEELAEVTVEARPDRSGGGGTVAAWTDGRGRYEVRSLAPGDWTVTARLWDDQRQARARVVLRRSDREVTRDLEFEPRLALTVQVLFDEEPLADARVSLRGQRITAERAATTDYEGRVRFDDLAPEAYRIGLRHARNGIVHNDQIDLRQDRELVIRLEGATVGGLVVSAADGEPVRDALLALRPVAGPEYLVTAATRSDGRFAIHRLQPNRYRLVAQARGFQQSELEVEVASGQTIDGLELRLEPAPGARIRVRLAAGQVPSRVHLLVRDPAGRTALAGTHQADAAGEVELPLPAGTWTVYVRADGGALATAGLVVPAAEPLALTLAPAGRLDVRVPALVASDLIGTVRISGPDGQPFWTVGPGGALEQQWPLVGGKAAVDGVPAGSWLLQVEAPDGQRWQGAAVLAGGAAAVTLE